MRKNETDPTKRIAGPIPFYDNNGQLLPGQTFSAAGETAIFNLTSGTFADTGSDASEAASTGMYYVPLTQAEVNYDTFLIVRLRKATYADQFFVIPIDNTPDVNVSTVAAGAVTSIQTGLATAAAVASVDTAVADVDLKIGTPAGASIAADIASVKSSVDSTQTAVADLHKVAFGRWKVFNNQLVLYDVDELTPIATFDLKDDTGAASSVRIFERVPA